MVWKSGIIQKRVINTVNGHEILYLREDGKFHCLNGPARQCYDKNGLLKHEEWYINGERSRLGGPAIISYFDNGQVKSDFWFKDGIQGRLDGPAHRSYDINGTCLSEVYLVNGLYHREGKPAARTWGRNGNLIHEGWYVGGHNHRLDGPAVVDYDQIISGKITLEMWFVHGQAIQVKDYPEIDFTNYPLSESDQMRLKLMVAASKDRN